MAHYDPLLHQQRFSSEVSVRYSGTDGSCMWIGQVAIRKEKHTCFYGTRTLITICNSPPLDPVLNQFITFLPCFSEISFTAVKLSVAISRVSFTLKINVPEISSVSITRVDEKFPKRCSSTKHWRGRSPEKNLYHFFAVKVSSLIQFHVLFASMPCFLIVYLP